jgi:HSP20 family protein
MVNISLPSKLLTDANKEITMSLVRYHSPSILDDFRKEMNQLFSDNPIRSLGENSSGLIENKWSPAVDIKEDEKQFTLVVDVPGVSNNDVKVYVDDNHRLVIEGSSDSEKKEEKEGYVRIERQSGSFYRAFGLPDNISSEDITAKVNHGLLTVVVPKTNKLSSREIKVEG